MMLSGLLSALAFILVGTSTMVSLPESLVLMGLGQALVGVFSGFMLSPALSEMVTAGSEAYPALVDSREVESLA